MQHKVLSNHLVTVKFQTFATNGLTEPRHHPKT